MTVASLLLLFCQLAGSAGPGPNPYPAPAAVVQRRPTADSLICRRDRELVFRVRHFDRGGKPVDTDTLLYTTSPAPFSNPAYGQTRSVWKLKDELIGNTTGVTENDTVLWIPLPQRRETDEGNQRIECQPRMKENLLFVCSRNQWRSPTAEGLFRNHPAYQARSAGTSEKARIRLSQKLVEWADVIIVMERRHRDILRERYGAELAGKRLVVLDIEDHYGFNDPELVELLRDKLAGTLGIEW